MVDLLKQFGIVFELLDKESRIVPCNKVFWDYLGMDMPSRPVPSDDVFPELVGLEDDIASIAREGAGTVRLPSIRRDALYFDLVISPVHDMNNVPVSVMLGIADASEIMQTHQALSQDRNEIFLLTNSLQSKNDALRSANTKLDELMKVIRKQNHELDLKVKLRTQNLNNSYFALISTLAHVAEFRDTDTGQHIYRIGRTSVIIGKAYGMNQSECETLFYSTLLHDIGKIGIPDAILLKPGPLTLQEWDVMRDHARIGAKILYRDDHKLFTAAREVALHHHEKWDGSGYPDKLAGENISLISRICAVADVFDALLSDRPYKKPWTTQEAVQVIIDGSGIAFDPDIVRIFLAVLPDIIDLRNESVEMEFLPPELD